MSKLSKFVSCLAAAPNTETAGRIIILHKGSIARLRDVLGVDDAVAPFLGNLSLRTHWCGVSVRWAKRSGWLAIGTAVALERYRTNDADNLDPMLVSDVDGDFEAATPAISAHLGLPLDHPVAE